MKKFLIFLFLVSFSVRLLFVFFFPLNSPDSGKYILLAENLKKYHFYTMNGVVPDDSRAPVYPAILFLVKNFCGKYEYIRYIQALIDSFTVVLFYFFSFLIVWNDKKARLSAVLYSVYPVFIASNSFILSETVALFFLISASVFLLLGMREYEFRRVFFCSCFAGVLFALSVLTRPAPLLFPLFFVVILYTGKFFFNFDKKALFPAVIFLFSFLFLLTPWMIRNYTAFSKFIPVSANLGGNLYIGSRLDWGGDYNQDIMKIRNNIIEDMGGGLKGSYIVDDKLKSMAVKNIKNDPFGYISLLPLKTLKLIFRVPGATFLKDNKLILYLFLFLHIAIVSGFFYVFFTLLIKKKITIYYLFPAAFVLYSVLLYTILVPIPRYFIPSVAMMIPLLTVLREK